MNSRAGEFYQIAPIADLLRRELALPAPALANLYGNVGLYLHPCAQVSFALPPHHLQKTIALGLDAQEELGPLPRCMPNALPFASESCRLIVAQHVFERIAEPHPLAEELMRVLAPEGMAWLFGFNPLSPWRPWLAHRARDAAIALRLESAQTWGNFFVRAGAELLDEQYFGGLLPGKAPREDADVRADAPNASMLDRLDGAWMLAITKRQSALTPLRRRRPKRALARKPQLAPSAQRKCA